MISKTLSVSQRFNTVPDTPEVPAEFAQLLFTLLLPHTDDFGRMSGDPFSIKMTVLPASVRPIEQFAAALESLHSVRLIELYEADSAIYLQISKFEEHQSGLHKRTESKLPAPSGKFPELPGNSRSRARAELNGTEQKGTEQNRTQGSNNDLVRGGSPHTTSDPELLAAPLKPPNGNGNGGNGNGHHQTTARSKRPIFTGQRLTVFEWMLDDCAQTLGPLTDAFDLHAWFFVLDAELVKAAVVLQKRDGGAWLQSQLVAEAHRRGLPIAIATPPPSKQSAQLAHTLATIRREEAEKRAARK